MAKSWAEQFNKMRPVTKDQLETARKHAARYIFVKDKDGNAVCQRCEREFVLPNTKHLQECRCPKCKVQLKVQHVWRAKERLEAIDWIVVPKVLNEKTMVLRYICGSAIGCSMVTAKELGRMYISEDHAEPEYYCEAQGGWYKGKSPYFVPWYMSYRENHWFCMYADLYKPNQSKKEMSKLNCFKYYPLETHYDNTRIASQMHYLVKFARLNEKLEKVGMQSLVDDNFRCYLNNSRTINFNKHKTNLIEMLRLDRPRWNYFKNHVGAKMLHELQTMKQFNEKEFDQLVKLAPSRYDRYTIRQTAEAYKLSVLRIAKYIKEQGLYSASKYEAYLNRINNLGWIMTDEYYLFPKDFEKFDEKSKVETRQRADELKRKELLEKVGKEAAKTATIALISNVIRTAPELQDMFADAEHGLKIYVPESVADLYMSGLVMHNCLSTFAERIVNKETLVFFIRKAEAPDKDYVAFEYNNGMIKQIYEANNKKVENAEVIQFAEAFVERLNVIDIMSRIA